MYVIKYHNAILIIVKRKINKYKLKLDKRIFYDFQNKHIKTITTCFSTIFVTEWLNLPFIPLGLDYILFLPD